MRRPRPTVGLLSHKKTNSENYEWDWSQILLQKCAKCVSMFNVSIAIRAETWDCLLIKYEKKLF
jgi:hypothetical protein